MTVASECLRILDEAAGGRLSDEDLDAIVKDLERVRNRRKAEGGIRSLEQEMFEAGEEMANDIIDAGRQEKRERMINAVTRGKAIDLAMRYNQELNDPSMALEAMTVGVNTTAVEGGRLSIDAEGKALVYGYMSGMMSDMRKNGVFDEFVSGRHDRDVSRELWDASLKAPEGNATQNQTAKKIAEIIHAARKAAIVEENRAGAAIRMRQGYVTRQTHNTDKMAKSFDAWADTIRDKLDYAAMEVDDTEAFLRSAWEAMVTGVRKSGPENDMSFQFKGPGNLAKKVSASRVLLFRNADEWFNYNEVYGVGNLQESILADFTRASNATALMRGLGTNPEAMFDKIISDLSEVFRSDPAKVKRLQRKSLKNQLAEVTGAVNITGGDTAILGYDLATVGRGYRAIQSMAKLGGAVISSITDTAAVMAERRYQGASLLEAIGDGLMAPVKGLSGREMRDFAELLSVGIDSALGAHMARFSAQDDVPGRISKLQSVFFKWNLLGPWTDAVKRGTGLMMARDLAMNNVSFDSLPPEMNRLLRQYGFDARKWEVARLSIGEGPDGVSYMLPGEVQNVRGAPFRGLSEPQQEKLRREVALALRAYLTDRVDFASPTPGARERAILRQGQQAGTVSGELVRTGMQFKAFPVTVLTKVLGRDIYGRGARSFGEAMTTADNVGAIASYIAASSVLGYVALQMKEMAKGRSPREMGGDLAIASMLQGGGLGIFGDFLLGQTNRFGNSLTETIVGPGIGTLADAQKILSKAIAGEDLGSEVLNFGKSNAPFINMFYTRTALDYLILYQLQEMANPGYLRRTERRIQREQGQTFLFPPSRAIPRGGGSRIFEGVR